MMGNMRIFDTDQETASMLQEIPSELTNPVTQRLTKILTDRQIEWTDYTVKALAGPAQLQKPFPRQALFINSLRVLLIIIL